MRQIQHDSYIAGIDDEARLAIVQNALQDRQARLVSWREEAMGGGGSGSELYTVSGVSRYAVTTQESLSSPPNSEVILGKATATML
jgi:hypothetical protein